MSRFAILPVVALFLLGCAVTEPVVPPRGQLLDFPVTNIEGGAIRLSNFRGKVVLLHFWSSWCAACKPELKELEALKRVVDANDVQIITVGVHDQIEHLRQTVEQENLELWTGVDTDDTIADQINIHELPVTYLLDREGHISMVHDPRDGKLKERFVGPRPWTDRRYMRLLQSLVMQAAPVRGANIAEDKSKSCPYCG